MKDGKLPDGEWIGTKDAARLWSEASGAVVTQATVRRWCRDMPPHMDGIDVFHIGDRYFIERDSLLDVFEARARAALSVVERERGKR